MIILKNLYEELILKNLNAERKHYDLYRTMHFYMVCTEFR